VCLKRGYDGLVAVHCRVFLA